MVTGSSNGLKLVNASLSVLAQNLELRLDRPVVDETGLDDGYDIELEWTGKAPEDLVKAVQDQLGLRLKPAKRQVELLVIESVD